MFIKHLKVRAFFQGNGTCLSLDYSNTFLGEKKYDQKIFPKFKTFKTCSNVPLTSMH